jgi:hypothetical protein
MATPMKQNRHQPVPSGGNTNSGVTSNTTQQRSLHTPVPRSRLNSKDIVISNILAGNPIDAVSARGSANTNSDGTGQTNMQILPPESPIGRNNTTTAHRTRFNSRDIPRSYSGQYSTESNNLLPLECLRSQQIVAQNVSLVVFLSTYLTFILFLQLVSASIISTATNVSSSSSQATFSNPWTQHLYDVLSSSWTVTNGLHCLITLLYLHWLKGSYLLDEQGELNAMTIWEQLEATCESTTYMRRILLIVPTVLSYMACLVSKFQPTTCTINIIFWSISMFAKLPQMNGVRLFGINRTAGIDDEFDNTTANAGVYHNPSSVNLSMPELEARAPSLPYAKRF